MTLAKSTGRGRGRAIHEISSTGFRARPLGEPIRGPDRGGRQHRVSLRRLLPGDGGRVYALGYLASYTDPSLDSVEREVTRADAVTTIVKAVDEYLSAAILLLFALDLYELFIDRIDAAEDSEAASACS